jgi:ribosomal protein S18 acetylase RimI-like enzyme
VRLLYVKEPEGDGDLRVVRQLARLTADRKVTSVRNCNAAINVLRKAASDRPFDVLVTSPKIDADALAGLVREILKVGLRVTLVPVVVDEDHSERAFKAGADYVLLLADGLVVNPGEIFRGLAHRFSHPPLATATVDASAKTPSSGTQALAQLLKLRKYLPETKPREPITVAIVARADDDLAEAAERLVPQLSPSARMPGLWELDQIIKEPGTALIVAREGRVIVGMLTLHTFRSTTGIHAWIQDVVVDQTAQGRGVSELLTQEAIRLSVQRGALTTELASRPSRIGTSKLFERLGFELRHAHLYRYRLSS